MVPLDGPAEPAPEKDKEEPTQNDEKQPEKENEKPKEETKPAEDIQPKNDDEPNFREPDQCYFPYF